MVILENSDGMLASVRVPESTQIAENSIADVADAPDVDASFHQRGLPDPFRYPARIQTDLELMEGISLGDHDAFTEFYDRTADKMRLLVLKLLKRQMDVEDVLQEIFSHVWKNAHKYNPDRGSPRAWIFMIGKSRALDRLRRRRFFRLPRLFREQSVQAGQINHIIQNESAERIRVALAQLPEAQRSAIQLAFFAGLPHESVAQCQSIPLGTAKTRIRLGLKKLGQLFGDFDRVAGV